VKDESIGLWDRRDFVMATGAAAGVGLTAQATEAADVSSFGTIVADRRYAASRAFASEAAGWGKRIAWIDGDITGFWFDELDVLWRSQKVTVSGLTAYGAFFCLERLALDRGLRVVFKGEHRRLDSGRASHAIAGPETVVTRAALDGLSDGKWAAQIARMALAAHGTAQPGVHLHKVLAAELEQPPLLISWVLAPKPRVRGGIA
jgi:hypothetical protein